MKLISRSVVLAGVCAAIVCPAAFSQEAFGMRVDVGFAFTANNRELPAGTYHFRRNGNAIVITGMDGKTAARMPVVADITRMRGEDSQLLTFDKVGDQRIVTEVWLPNRDGALVLATKNARAQDTVRLVKGPGTGEARAPAGAVGTR